MRSIRAVDVKDFAKENAQTSPVHFQRMAKGFIDQLKKKVTADSSLCIGPAQLNPLDLLHSELNLACGRALMQLDLARKMQAAHGDHLVWPTGFALGDNWPFILSIPQRSTRLRLYGGLQQKVSSARAALYQKKTTFQETVVSRKSMARAQTNASDQTPFLAFMRESNLVTSALPIMEALKQHYDAHTTFFLPPRAWSQNPIGSGFPKIITEPSGPTNRSLLKRLLAFLTTIAPNDSVLDEQQCQLLLHAVKRTLMIQWNEIFKYLVSVDQALQNSRPSCVFIGNPYTLMGRLAARLCVPRKIPTVCIEHGTIFAEDPSWYDCPIDHHYVTGYPSRDALMSAGVPEESIHIMGAPHLDDICQTSKTWSRGQPRQLLVATSGPGHLVSTEQHRWFIEILFNAVRRDKNINWSVKLHPKDRSHYYHAEGGPWPDNLTLYGADSGNPASSVFSFLKDSAGLVTVTSTVALDSMLVDVPVITVDVTRGDDQMKGAEYLSERCTMRVNSADQLYEKSAQLWKGARDSDIDRNMRAYIQRHYVNQGDATMRVAAHVMEHLA